MFTPSAWRSLRAVDIRQMPVVPPPTPGEVRRNQTRDHREPTSILRGDRFPGSARSAREARCSRTTRLYRRCPHRPSTIAPLSRATSKGRSSRLPRREQRLVEAGPARRWRRISVAAAALLWGRTRCGHRGSSAPGRPNSPVPNGRRAAARCRRSADRPGGSRSGPPSPSPSRAAGSRRATTAGDAGTACRW